MREFPGEIDTWYVKAFEEQLLRRIRKINDFAFENSENYRREHRNTTDLIRKTMAGQETFDDLLNFCLFNEHLIKE